MMLSGKVAILSDDGAVKEMRDLGPEPIEVKANVRPLTEVFPDLSENEALTAPAFIVKAKSVQAVYGKQTIAPEPPSLEERVAALEELVSRPAASR